MAKKRLASEANSKVAEVNDQVSESSANDDRRQSLVLAAFHLMAKKGVEGLRTRDVATQVGMNIGTLYYYFPTKEGLIQGVVDYIVQHIVTIQTPIASLEVHNPRDELRLHFSNLVFELRETPDIFRVMGELLLRSERDPAIYPILKKTDDGWLHYLIALLEAGIQQEFFRADFEPRIAARVIMCFFKGVPTQLGMPAGDLEQGIDYLERWLIK